MTRFCFLSVIRCIGDPFAAAQILRKTIAKTYRSRRNKQPLPPNNEKRATIAQQPN